MLDGNQLFQVICLAAEDVLSTRNTVTSPLPSDHLRTSVIRKVTELCTRKFLPVLEVHGRRPAISSLQLLTIVYYNNCGKHETLHEPHST